MCPTNSAPTPTTMYVFFGKIPCTTLFSGGGGGGGCGGGCGGCGRKKREAALLIASDDANKCNNEELRLALLDVGHFIL